MVPGRNVESDSCSIDDAYEVGIIHVARQAGAQIIPMALDYDRKAQVCSVMFGSPMAGEELEDRAEGIGRLRDAMATLRWELMARHPVLCRAEVSVEGSVSGHRGIPGHRLGI